MPAELSAIDRLRADHASGRLSAWLHERMPKDWDAARADTMADEVVARMERDGITDPGQLATLPAEILLEYQTSENARPGLTVAFSGVSGSTRPVAARLLSTASFAALHAGLMVTLSGGYRDYLIELSRRPLDGSAHHPAVTVLVRALAARTESVVAVDKRTPRQLIEALLEAKVIDVVALLDGRQRDCVVLLGDGLDTKTIAARLAMTPGAVNEFLSRAVQKLTTLGVDVHNPSVPRKIPKPDEMVALELVGLSGGTGDSLAEIVAAVEDPERLAALARWSFDRGPMSRHDTWDDIGHVVRDDMPGFIAAFGGWVRSSGGCWSRRWLG